MRRILMVCTGNTCRSVMAAALFQKFATEYGTKVEVDSAGLFAVANTGAAEAAQQVMSEQDIDLSEHRAKQVDFTKLADYDLILAMTNGHKERIIEARPDLAAKVFTLKDFANRNRQETSTEKAKENMTDIDDPFGRSVEVYRATVAEISTAIKVILANWQED